MAESPDFKRIKVETNDESSISAVIGNKPPTCQHFVKRKKRYCRLTPAKNEIFCGEHLPITEDIQSLEQTDTTAPDSSAKNRNRRNARVPCPLNPKHTVCARKLHKHIKICNTLVKNRPDYIIPGLNAGNIDNISIDGGSDSVAADFKLNDVDAETIDAVVEKINTVYGLHKIDEKIVELTASHPILAAELCNDEYGHETRRHLIQTSTILGYLNHFQLLDDHTSYVEYGAGKGQVSYWLAQALSNYPNSNVLLIDRAAVRYKKDNKLDGRHAVQRIRADIADFDISKHATIQTAQRIVGLGKHLCGAATDFAIECSIQGNQAAAAATQNETSPKTIAIIIALCCHHRCEWKHFVGKEFFTQHQISPKEFVIITKMVGWAICGSGMSREKRKEIEEQRLRNETHDNHEPEQNVEAAAVTNTKRDQQERKEIGQKCKRLIDFARICYLEKNEFKCSLKRYVSSHITLENVCLVAIHKSHINK